MNINVDTLHIGDTEDDDDENDDDNNNNNKMQGYRRNIRPLTL
jgi:hypothetical protein